MEDIGNKKSSKTIPLLKVGLTITSSMHENRREKKGSISTYQLVLGAALFQFNATTDTISHLHEFS
jgi:hypothetical protein